MAMCPLLREECITIGCAWWYAANEIENGQGSVSKLPDLLNYIADDLWDKLNDVQSKLDDVNYKLGDGIYVHILEN